MAVKASDAVGSTKQAWAVGAREHVRARQARQEDVERLRHVAPQVCAVNDELWQWLQRWEKSLAEGAEERPLLSRTPYAGLPTEGPKSAEEGKGGEGEGTGGKGEQEKKGKV